MNEPATIYIIDDDPAVRESLTLLLEMEHVNVLSFACAEDFLMAAPWGPCSCAIVDIHMPGMDGMQLQQELARRGSPLPLIFLTGYGDIAQSVRAVKSGAVDFLTKPVTAYALLSSVQAALLASASRLNEVEQHQSNASRLASLTEREREVMALAVQGLANKEIARRMDISHRTVEIHKARVMHKTRANTLVELMRIAEAVKPLS